MRFSHLAITLAASALLVATPAMAASHGGGGYRGGGGSHGGGYHNGGGKFNGGGVYRGGSNFRGGGRYYGGGFNRGFHGGSFGHSSFGFGYGYGYPYYGGYYGGFGYPYYGSYYAPAYPRGSTTIIQQAPSDGPSGFEGGVKAGPGAPPQQTWYFCKDSNQFYPYVRTCDSAWQEVPAIPPPPPSEGK